MKKVFLAILATIAVVGMVSCNKDDNGKGGKGGKKAVEVNVKIDGDFADWADVEGIEVPEGAPDDHAALLTLKAAADATNLYVYIESQLAEGQSAAPIEFFINNDGDTSTGFSSWIWSNVGWEFMLESEVGYIQVDTLSKEPLKTEVKIRNMAEDMNVYKSKVWQGADGAQLDGWDKTGGAVMEQLELSGFCTSAGKVVNGIAFVEISITRSAINARAKGSLGLGVAVYDQDWNDIGILPIGTDTGEVDMMEVALP